MRIRGGPIVERGALARPIPTESDDGRRTDGKGDAYQGGSTAGGSAHATPARSSSASHREAAALLDRGRHDEAIDVLRAVIDDVARPAEERAAAAAWGGILIRRDRPREAEVLLATAQQLAPSSYEPMVRWLAVELRLDGGDVAGALESSRAAVQAHPNDPLAHRSLSSALLADAQPEAALAAAERAVELAGDRKWSAEHRLLLGVGYAAAFANRPQRVISAVQESLHHVPNDALAHALIADFVIPSFEGAHRKTIEAKFDRANRRYQAGDFEAVKQIALEILSIDPKDGLAHALYGIASKAQRGADQPLVSALDSEPKRAALIAALEGRTREADVSGRPGRPSDLFPEWHQLTDLQKATVAASVLPYGCAIPKLIDAGARYRFALPGTTCADSPAEPLGLGRYSYAARGRINFDEKRVFTGVEEIDRAARGHYNTVTHEFGHLVHALLLDLAARRDREEPLDARDSQLSFIALSIDSRFRQARMQRGGEQLLDAYSGKDVYEYFAQGIMSYLPLSPDGPMRSETLRARNPALFALSAELVKLLS